MFHTGIWPSHILDLIPRILKQNQDFFVPMAAARKCSWEQCGKSAEDTTLSPCGNCWAARFCSPACQKAGWPSHKTRCKESAWKQFFRAEFAQGDEEQGGGVRELFMGMAENDELAGFIDRDESEFYPIYLRDKFMTRGELTDSGIDKVLEERQIASRSKGSVCPAAASVLNETFAFADTSTVSSAVSKLAERVAAAQGNVLYCPGAMLDLNGVALALATECENIDTLVCVSSFEVDTLASTFGVHDLLRRPLAEEKSLVLSQSIWARQLGWPMLFSTSQLTDSY